MRERPRFGTRRLVYVDASAFAVLHETSDAARPPTHRDAHPDADRVRGEFERLLDEYERGETILVTHEGTGGGLLAAVCEVERLRPWLLRAADAAIEDNPELDLDPNLAASLVVMQRQGIGEVLTVDDRYDALDVTALPVGRVFSGPEPAPRSARR